MKPPAWTFLPVRLDVNSATVLRSRVRRGQRKETAMKGGGHRP